jgi:crossover junction endodeoxyribonuclease RuvC
MSEPPRCVLGIDPGSRVTGWGVVTCEGTTLRALAWGTLRLDVSGSVPARLEEIHQGVSEILREHSPDSVAIEEAFVGRNVRSAIRLAEARAAAMLAARMAQREVHEVSPALVKKALTGHGRASKETVRRAVMSRLGWASDDRPPPYDAADALAIGVCVLGRLSTPAGLTLPGSVGRRGRGRRRWTMADIDRQNAERLNAEQT